MSSADRLSGADYEFRVWGRHKEVCRRLADVADSEIMERLDDWYLLVRDPVYNVKIRDGRLKVKRLEGQRAGFESWSASWYDSAIEAPKPFDKVMLALERQRGAGDDFDRLVGEAIDRVGSKHDLRAVFVSKNRRRFRVGSMYADSTAVKIAGRPGRLRTVAIEGPELDDLRSLRHSLGLDKEENLAFHLAVEREWPRAG